jgi:tetratricopeptide (TPR) repeat protein
MSKPQRGRTRQSPTTGGNLPAELVPESPSTAADDIKSARTSLSTPRRPTYPEAVARYEAGMRALQEHRFGEAAEAFRTILTQYPEEKELHDRVRIYLSLCERQLRGSTPEPRTVEERLYAATIAINAGQADTAIEHLAAAVAEDPDHDGALYMLGVAHALRADTAAALSYLQRAIARNPDNRALALQDDDLERLLQDESVRAAIEAAGGPRPIGDARLGRVRGGEHGPRTSRGS